MTTLAALLTLALPALAAPMGRAALAAPGRAAVDGFQALEHVALPEVAGPITLRVRSLERLIVLSAPRGRGLAALARAVRLAPRAICPVLEEGAGELRLRCRSNRIVARLAKRTGGTLLEVGETRGLPWSGDDAAPLVPFDPVTLGFGEACPGSTASGRGECLIGRGALAAAREELAAEGADAGHAALRLGDLALQSGDTRTAATHWARARGAPWERMAATRLCELSAACLAAPRADALFATGGLPAPLARDLVLRRARALAFMNRPLDGLRSLLASAPAGAACTSAPSTCQRVALATLALPGAAGIEALTLWLDLPARDVGPAAYDAELAASAVAAGEGAPAFAANLLASAAARAPASELGAHLLRTAELYLEAGDRVRAGVVLEFARARGRKALGGARWAAVQRALVPSRTSPATAATKPSDLGHLVADADRATRAARALSAGGRT